MLKFYHFVIDQKFIPLSKKCFDNAALTENRFLYVRQNNEPLHFIKGLVEVLSLSEAKDILTNPESCDVVVLHCLYSLPYKLIASINSRIKVIWYGWGYDMYSIQKPGFPLITVNPYLPRTNNYVLSQETDDLYSVLKNVYKDWRRDIKILFKGNYFKEAISRVDFFAGVFPSERDTIARENSFFKAKQIVHNYINYDEFDSLGKDWETVDYSDSILVNNSANFEGNHLDVFNVFVNCKLNLSDFKLVTPLSYSGTRDYIKVVKEKGQLLFDNSFYPIENFMPLAEYTKIINTCRIAIFGYIRQAATCNILTCLWNGTKVVMPKNSINYRFYKSVGMIVYSFDDLTDSFIRTPENKENIVVNRGLIYNMYSYNAWKRDLNGCINILKSRV